MRCCSVCPDVIQQLAIYELLLMPSTADTIANLLFHAPKTCSLSGCSTHPSHPTERAIHFKQIYTDQHVGNVSDFRPAVECTDRYSRLKTETTIIEDHEQVTPSIKDERPIKVPKPQSLKRTQHQYQEQQHSILPTQTQPMILPQPVMAVDSTGHRQVIRESRIKDRLLPQESRDSSLRIKLELDLEVEVCTIVLLHPVSEMLGNGL